MWDLFLPRETAKTERLSRKELTQVTCVGLVLFAFLLVHFIFLIYYLYVRLWPLMALNCVSVAVYLVGLRLNQVGNTNAAVFFINLEICFYCILNTYFLGWAASTQWFIPTAILPVQIMYPISKRKRNGYLIMLMGSMLVCFLLRNLVEPLYKDFDATVVVLMNLTTVLAGSSIVLHYHGIANRITEMYYKQHIAALSNEANLDPMTGLWNRRYAIGMLEELINRKTTPFSVAMIDVDFFKRVNDTYGHPFGDLVLQQLSDLILKQLRVEDVAVRWGGEEFLIILTTGGQNTLRKLNSIREQIEDFSFSDGILSVKLTITGGVSEYVPGMKINQLIAQSDRALYYGKHQGRNRITLDLDIPAKEA